jgi:hypothetical protein
LHIGDAGAHIRGSPIAISIEDSLYVGQDLRRTERRETSREVAGHELDVEMEKCGRHLRPALRLERAVTQI